MSHPQSKCTTLLLLILILTGEASHGQKSAASPGQPPGSQAGGQAGSTPYFETEMLAYGSANQLSAAIARKVCFTTGLIRQTAAAGQAPLPSPMIIIFDQSSFQNLGTWQSVVASAAVLEEAYKTLLSPAQRNQLEAKVPPPPGVQRGPGGAAGTTSPSFIQGGADLGSLITAIAASATNTASTFTIQDSTMAVSILHQLERINCNVRPVYYPLFGSYADIDKAQTKVTLALDDLNKVRAFVQSEVLANAGNSNTSPALSILTDLNTQYDALLKTFLGQSSTGSGPSGPASGPGNQGASPQGSGSPNSGQTNNSQSTSIGGYASLVQGAELEDLIKRDDTYILYADVVAAGGTQRDIKNVFTLLTGDWLSYSGGLIVNVALIKSKDTTLAFADTLRYRSDFHHRDLWDVLGLKTFTTPRDEELVENVNAGENELTLCNEDRRHHWLKGPTAAGCPVLAPGMTRVALDRDTVIGGTPLIGTVTLDGPAGADITVPLQCTNLNEPGVVVASIPGNLVVLRKRSSVATFRVNTVAVNEMTPVSISANFPGGAQFSTTLQISPPSLSSISLRPTSEPGRYVGTVVLDGVAPDGGTTVQLTSSNPAAAAFFDQPGANPSAEVEGGNNTGTFQIQTNPVPADTLVAISATDENQKMLQALLTVDSTAPIIGSVSTDPSPATTAGGFSLTVNGSNFDPNTARIVIIGPGCPAGCTIANGALTVTTPTRVAGPVPPSPAGNFSVQVQQVQDGVAMISNSQALVVHAPAE